MCKGRAKLSAKVSILLFLIYCESGIAIYIYIYIYVYTHTHTHIYLIFSSIHPKKYS